MTEPAVGVDIFAEDHAHERFVTVLVSRLAKDDGIPVDARVLSARGGHGRALAELDLFQRPTLRAARDVLVVAIDANCEGWNPARRKIRRHVIPARYRAVAIACPDPHVERWYLSDPSALAALGAHTTPERRKCERDLYKQRLTDCLRSAGHPVTLGGIEFAEDIVGAMDLYRAGKNEPSLRAFVKDLRAALRTARP